MGRGVGAGRRLPLRIAITAKQNAEAVNAAHREAHKANDRRNTELRALLQRAKEDLADARIDFLAGASQNEPSASTLVGLRAEQEIIDLVRARLGERMPLADITATLAKADALMAEAMMEAAIAEEEEC